MSMGTLCNAAPADLDKPTVAAALTAAAAILQKAGWQPCRLHVPGMAQAAAKVLTGQAACQATHDDSDEEVEADDNSQVCGRTGMTALRVCEHMPRPEVNGREQHRQ